jgi:hypothetical protein
MESSQNTIVIVQNAERRGTRVCAPLFGGGVVELVVWDEDYEENVVYLCTADRFSRLLNGDTEGRPIGFPASSVKWN